MIPLTTVFGVRVFETPHAVVKVQRPKPHTLDMQNLVDCVGVREEWKPGAYMSPDGLFAHPEIYRQVREQLRTPQFTAESFLWRT